MVTGPTSGQDMFRTRRRSTSTHYLRAGAGFPGSPSDANSSAVDLVDFLARRFLRRRPAFSCLFLRFTVEAAVREAMAIPRGGPRFLALPATRCQRRSTVVDRQARLLSRADVLTIRMIREN